MYINTEKKEKEKKGQLSIMTSTKKKRVNSLWCVMTIQIEKETKRSGPTLNNVPVTKKKY